LSKNFFMDRYLAVLIGCPLAFLIIYFRVQLREFIGSVSFAERIFGSGGTSTFILLLGLMLFVLSLMWGFGALQKYIFGAIGTFF